MGVEGGDWYREEPRRGRPLAFWVLSATIVLAALFIASPQGRSALGLRHTQAPTPKPPASAQTPGALVASGAPADGSTPTLYPPSDPYRRYLADEATCPGGERTDLPPAQQIQVMLCLINWARERAGLNALAQTVLLASTAKQKADE